MNIKKTPTRCAGVVNILILFKTNSVYEHKLHISLYICFKFYFSKLLFAKLYLLKKKYFNKFILLNLKTFPENHAIHRLINPKVYYQVIHHHPAKLPMTILIKMFCLKLLKNP